jgi:hypothetical protein
LLSVSATHFYYSYDVNCKPEQYIHFYEVLKPESFVYTDSLPFDVITEYACLSINSSDSLLARASNAGHPARFVSVPAAVVEHPWWSNGARHYMHFFKWAVGDGHLWDHYPERCYLTFPNIAETMLLPICCIVSAHGYLRHIKNIFKSTALHGALLPYCVSLT